MDLSLFSFLYMCYIVSCPVGGGIHN